MATYKVSVPHVETVSVAIPNVPLTDPITTKNVDTEISYYVVETVTASSISDALTQVKAIARHSSRFHSVGIEARQYNHDLNGLDLDLIDDQNSVGTHTNVGVVDDNGQPWLIEEIV